MKLLNYSFGFLAVVVVLFSSCRDFVEPNIPYSEFDTGVYLRTIEQTSDTFDITNLANAKTELTLEAVDIEDGRTVESVDVMVQHRRLAGEVLTYTPLTDAMLKTIPASDFTTNSESRFLRVTFELTAAEAIAAVGFEPKDIKKGDVFEFRLALHDTKGRIFDSKNATTNIEGAVFYSSPFQYFITVK